MRLIALLTILLFLGGCSNRYFYQQTVTDPITGEVRSSTFEASSWRKFAYYEMCFEDPGTGRQMCVKAEGIDRQSASPLEQAAADVVRASAGIPSEQ